MEDYYKLRLIENGSIDVFLPCSICKEIKSIYCFRVKRDSEAGHQPYCKECGKNRKKV